jgi:hypothetical protein
LIKKKSLLNNETICLLQLAALLIARPGECVLGETPTTAQVGGTRDLHQLTMNRLDILSLLSQRLLSLYHRGV